MTSHLAAALAMPGTVARIADFFGPYHACQHQAGCVIFLSRYGPFWIATTLVFVTAVTGNYASYVSYHHKASLPEGDTQAWYYDIDKVGTYPSTVQVSALFLVAPILPLCATCQLAGSSK